MTNEDFQQELLNLVSNIDDNLQILAEKVQSLEQSLKNESDAIKSEISTVDGTAAQILLDMPQG